MSIYAIADTHLSLDDRIEKPMDVFGGMWENHCEKLEKNWCRLVKPEDTVIIAGDISWGLKLEEAIADFEWISRLPGKKIITKGNHDLWWSSTNRLNSLYDNIHFLQNHAYVVDDNTVVCGTRGWISPGAEDFSEHDKKIYRRELLRLEMSLEEGKKTGRPDIIGVLHYPPTNEKFERSEFTDMLSDYGVKTCVYGHLHGRDAFPRGIKGNFRGVDYRLVSLDYLATVPLQIR